MLHPGYAGLVRAVHRTVTDGPDHGGFQPP